MKLTRTLYYRLKNFFNISSYDSYGNVTASIQEKHSNLSSYGKVYHIKDIRDWNPGFAYIGSMGSHLVTEGCDKIFVGTSRGLIPVIRNSASLLSALCNKETCYDNNGVLYHSSNGIIMDGNKVPLMFLEAKPLFDSMGTRMGYERRLVCNTYIFKRENLVSKIILDTVVPLLIGNKYKDFDDEDPQYFLTSFKNDVLNNRTKPFRGVEFRPITIDFWCESIKGNFVSSAVIKEIMKTVVFE